MYFAFLFGGSWSSNASLPINGLISFINLCFTLSKASRYWRIFDYKKRVIIFVTTHLKIKEQTGKYSAPLTSSTSNKSSFADCKQCLIARCCCVNKKSKSEQKTLTWHCNLPDRLTSVFKTKIKKEERIHNLQKDQCFPCPTTSAGCQFCCIYKH